MSIFKEKVDKKRQFLVKKEEKKQKQMKNSVLHSQFCPQIFSDDFYIKKMLKKQKKKYIFQLKKERKFIILLKKVK